MTVKLTPAKNGRKEGARAKDITREIKGGVSERLWKEKINPKAVRQNGDIDKNTWSGRFDGPRMCHAMWQGKQ